MFRHLVGRTGSPARRQGSRLNERAPSAEDAGPAGPRSRLAPRRADATAQDERAGLRAGLSAYSRPSTRSHDGFPWTQQPSGSTMQPSVLSHTPSSNMSITSSI